MIDKRTPFFAYRYLVTPKSNQISLQQVANKNKEELMYDIIHQLAMSTKTEFIKGNKRFLFYGSQSKKNIFILKYAREIIENRYTEGDDDIEVNKSKEVKYIYIILDTEHQIVLMERNHSVFHSISQAVSVLSDFFREKMYDFDYVVNIYPLASKRKFWNYVESADEIFELALVMNAPNMAFFGHDDTRDVLRQIKEATNNEEFDIAFKNKEGNLKIAKETLGGWIDYVREIGGKYLLKFSVNGIKETKTSSSDTVKTYISKKKNTKFTEEEIENIKTKIEAINTLESRDDAEDK